MIFKEIFEGPVGDYCIARNTIKCLFLLGADDLLYSGFRFKSIWKCERTDDLIDFVNNMHVYNMYVNSLWCSIEKKYEKKEMWAE